jgi:hypothetical protein
MVDDAQIEDVFAEHADLEDAARELVRAANRYGGEDNITVICFRLSGAEDTAQTAAMDLPTEENALPDEDTLSGIDEIFPATAEPIEADAVAGRGHGARLILLVLVLAALAAALLYLLDVL